MGRQPKTNVMRILDKCGIPYIPHFYDCSDGAIDGVSVAHKLGQDPAAVFKTLVTRGGKAGFFVFVIPVGAELDLKKAAIAAGEKSVEMLHVKELLPLTGYIRGGCSPIGMKKAFPTFFDLSAKTLTAITVSGGKPGTQVELNPAELLQLVDGKLAPLTF